MDDHWTTIIRVPKPRRSWFQIRSRAILLLTLMTAVLLAVVNARIQRNAMVPFGAGFSDRQIQEVELAWARAGLSGYQRRGSALFVPEAERESYADALRPRPLRDAVMKAILQTTADFPTRSSAAISRYE